MTEKIVQQTEPAAVIAARKTPWAKRATEIMTARDAVDAVLSDKSGAVTRGRES